MGAFPSWMAVLLVLGCISSEEDPPMFRPRSSREYYVPFPLAKPTLDNFPALCRYSDSRFRFSPDMLPPSSFGYLRRQGKAINRMESWYSTCCAQNETLANETPLGLCCAQQAWELALSQFCDEESSIKNVPYHCCYGEERKKWNCFEQDAPNPTYVSTSQGSISTQLPPEPGFIWNTSTCQSETQSQASTILPRVEKPSRRNFYQILIKFPPGRPTSINIDMICRFWDRRPRYNHKCLLQTHSWLNEQGMAINRFEKKVEKCCKGQTEIATCANKEWENVMDQFCLEEQPRKFPCCDLSDKEEQYKCFADEAPDPDYSRDYLQRPVTLFDKFKPPCLMANTYK